jgi:hypothetical protein
MADWLDDDTANKKLRLVVTLDEENEKYIIDDPFCTPVSIPSHSAVLRESKIRKRKRAAQPDVKDPGFDQYHDDFSSALHIEFSQKGKYWRESQAMYAHGRISHPSVSAKSRPHRSKELPFRLYSSSCGPENLPPKKPP